MARKKAFTLAEVLITLGIIGVVAAMTMPTLLNSTQGAQYRTAYKKAMSVLSQAVVLNVALDDYDLSQTLTTGSLTDGTSASVYNLFKNRMNVVSTNNGQGWGTAANGAFGTAAESNYTLFFNYGITFTFPNNAGNCTDVSGIATHSTNCAGAIDINGAKNPNVTVACDGSTSGNSCEVKSPTDIYPVKFGGQTILPNSAAARAVMYKGK
jgi:prepilin-type N-terminal cleavage/methylation domain-containing protein